MLQLAYLIYFGVSEKSDYLQVFTLSEKISSISSLLNSINIDASFFKGISFTILQVVLGVNCFQIYRKGFDSYSKHKITSKPFLLGIGGNSGVGKTTISENISNIFTSINSSVIKGDDMHKWQRGHKKWEEFTHLNPKANLLHEEIAMLNNLKMGKKILRKAYDHNKGTFTNALSIIPKNLIIFEGLHPFYLSRQRQLYDLKIFIKPDQDLSNHWKIIRDIDKRGYTKEQVLSNLCQRYAGPFDQEFIAGTFIVFMGTLFFSLNFLSLSLSKKKRLLFIISIILCFLTTLITGDRNPFISLIITLFIFFLIERNFRKDFFKFFSVLFIIGLFTTLLNVHLYERYVSAGRDLLSVPEKFDFFKDKKEKFESLQESNHLNNVEKNSYLSNFKKKFNNTQWGAHYLVSIEMFKKKPMTGYGYQSYRIECHKYDYIKSSMANVRCSSHPHNYIIQLFSETGLIGFILYILFLMSIFYKLKDLKNNLNKPLAIFLGALLFSFLFPFKPSGSIFSSMNNSFLFYLIGWVVYSFNLTDIRVLRK